MSDSDLDKLFKDAAEKYQSSFDEGAWEDLQVRLSSNNAFTFFKGIGSIIGIFILGAVLIWWFTPEGSGHRDQAASKDPTTALSEEQSFGEGTSSEQLKTPTTAGQEETGSIKPSSKNDHQIEADKKSSPSFGEDSNDRSTNNSQPDVSRKSGPLNTSDIIHRDPRHVQQQNPKRPVILKQTQDPQLLERLDYLPFTYSLFSGDLIKFNRQVEQVDTKKPLRKPFAIKISYSPDLSSVGYFKPGKAGSNYGVMLEYFFSHKWSIATGAVYSRKIYQTEEEQIYNYYGSYSSSTSITGDCRIIDIPLNLTYYLKQSDKHSLFLTAGSSSYLMLNEKYDYLTVTNGNEKAWSQELKGENNHFFGLLNLSVGYERRIKDDFYLQLEPFLKAPISGIGEGKIDLVSTGAFLNLKYRFR